MTKEEKENQEKMRDARASAWYGDIWKTVDKCVFCDLKDKYIICEENGLALCINLYPYIDGHLMIIPREHISSPKQLNQSQWNTVRKFTYLGKKLIKKVHGISNMWTMIREGGESAQMTVAGHMHIHLIPFDNQDLCVWNFRKLNYTPLENTQKYLDEMKDILKLNDKFKEKYNYSNSLPIVVDIILKDKKRNIIFQKKTKQAQFVSNIITIPGGHVDDTNIDLVDSLISEVKEELNIELKKENIKLIDSRIMNMEFVNHFAKFSKEKSYVEKFVLNTYIYSLPVDIKDIKPSDDCESIVLVKQNEIGKNNDINEDMKGIISKALNK